MSLAAQVTWAETDARNSQIVAIGGVRKSFFGTSHWQLSADEAIAAIQHDEWSFIVEIDDTRQWLDIVEEPNGQKSLSTDGPIRSVM